LRAATDLTRGKPDCRTEVHTLFPEKSALIVGQTFLVVINVRVEGLKTMIVKTRAKYHLGQVVRHKKHPFRGVIFDVDPEFSNTEEWYDAIPEDSRPLKQQPFYHLLAENEQSYYVAYVSEQNLVADYSGEPVDHPDIPDLFGPFQDGHYPLHFQLN
jgi:heat shock protein HspQ